MTVTFQSGRSLYKLVGVQLITTERHGPTTYWRVVGIMNNELLDTQFNKIVGVEP